MLLLCVVMVKAAHTVSVSVEPSPILEKFTDNVKCPDNLVSVKAFFFENSYSYSYRGTSCQCHILVFNMYKSPCGCATGKYMQIFFSVFH